MKKIEEENKEGVNHKSLTMPEIDYLITSQNATHEHVLNILKQSGHVLFEDANVDDDNEIQFGQGLGAYCYIRINNRQEKIYIRSLDRLQDNLFNDSSTLFNLLQKLHARHNFINCTIYSDPGDVWLSAQCQIVITGGISQTAFLETVKEFASNFVGARIIYDELMHQYD
jgi:hypothetical protein